MKGNKVLVGIFCCCVIIAAAIFFFDHGDKRQDYSRASHGEAVKGERIGQSEPESSDPGISAEDRTPTVKHVFKPAGSEALTELKEVRRRLGFIDERDREAYESYSVSTLKEMGESGDITALTVLGGIYYDTEQPEKAERVFEKAAMFGSTAALLTLGGVKAGVAAELARFKGGYSEKYREQLLQGLAWMKVAELRGEPSTESSLSSLLQGSDISLTPEEQQSVEQRAHELHKKLSKERERRGLGPFDRSHVEFLNSFDGWDMGVADKPADAPPK